MARRVRRIIDRLFQDSRTEPDWGALPVVTHHMYQASCRAIGRNSGCGKCELCKFHLVLDAVAQASGWVDAGKPLFGGGQRWRWQTVSSALTEYAACNADGYVAPSPNASLDGYARLGVLAHTTAPHDSNAIMAAEDHAVVRAALEGAYDASNDRGLGAALCVLMLLARRAGTPVERRTRWGARYWRTEPAAWGAIADAAGVSELAARGVVESGERRVAVELCARGLVRPPTKPNLDVEIAARRRQLEQRRLH